MKLELAAQQMFWAMGAMERMMGLGIIGNFPFHICPDEIDRWGEVDARRHEVVGNDQILSALVFYLCRDAGMTEDGDIRRVAFLVREFRDHRNDLAKYMLEQVAQH